MVYLKQIFETVDFGKKISADDKKTSKITQHTKCYECFNANAISTIPIIIN